MNARASHKVRRRSTLRDGARALGLALAVHAGGLGLLWLGSLTWQPDRPARVTPSFTLVDAAPYIEAEQREERERLAEAQAREAQERLERARREEAERQRRLEREREQERAEDEREALLERQRQQQLEREAERARQAEQQRELERQRRRAEQERLQELEELRRQRERARTEREEQERRLADIAERREAEEARQRAEAEAERRRLAREQAEAAEREATLREEYVATIAELVTRNWIRPPTTQPGVRCNVRVVQIPGGEIIDQAISSPCNADPATRRSILAAVERAAVLPYRGYEDVFEREIIFEFVYNG